MKLLEQIPIYCHRAKGYLNLMQEGFFIKSKFTYFSQNKSVPSNLKESDCNIVTYDEDWGILKYNILLCDYIRRNKIPLRILLEFEKTEFKRIVNCLNFAELNCDVISKKNNYTLTYSKRATCAYHFNYENVNYKAYKVDVAMNKLNVYATNFYGTEKVLSFSYPNLSNLIFYYWAVWIFLTLAPQNGSQNGGYCLFLRNQIGKPDPHTIHRSYTHPDYIFLPGWEEKCPGYFKILKDNNLIE